MEINYEVFKKNGEQYVLIKKSDFDKFMKQNVMGNEMRKKEFDSLDSIEMIEIQY